MIRSWRHKGLRGFYEAGSIKGIDPAQSGRLRRILGFLDNATKPSDMGLPGFKLHPLKGEQAGRWSVWVSGNWRVTFAFEGTDAADVDLEDYH